MRIGFHKSARPSREVGLRAYRECCRAEPGGRRFRQETGIAPRPTVAVVDLDLGTDDLVFIRGEGGGLRWDKGQLMTCDGPGTWVWSPSGLKDRLEFQLLLNDEVWARGETVVLEPGGTIELTPDFEWPEIPKTV